MATTPGHTKAARQSTASIKNPDSSAALATPMLPNTPLIASGTPVLVRPSTTMARPTG